MLGTNRQTRAGSRRMRITLLQATETRSESGDVVTTMNAVGTYWATVEFPKTGNREEYQGDSQTAVTRMTATMYKRTVDEKWMVRYEGKDYDILSVGEAHTYGYIMLTCERRI